MASVRGALGSARMAVTLWRAAEPEPVFFFAAAMVLGFFFMGRIGRMKVARSALLEHSTETGLTKHAAVS